MKQVNCGFEDLRRHIPSAAAAKKMSKVETLRHAVEYIQSLQRLLGADLVVPEMNSMKENEENNLTEDESSIEGEKTPDSPRQNSVFSFPSPLTPRTPSVFNAGHGIPPLTAASSSQHESGYETSSYYSSRWVLWRNVFVFVKYSKKCELLIEL